MSVKFIEIILMDKHEENYYDKSDFLRGQFLVNNLFNFRHLDLQHHKCLFRILLTLSKFLCRSHHSNIDILFGLPFNNFYDSRYFRVIWKLIWSSIFFSYIRCKTVGEMFLCWWIPRSFPNRWFFLDHRKLIILKGAAKAFTFVALLDLWVF